MKHPKEVNLSACKIAGLSLRTKNEDEFNPQTAKIPALWQYFSQKEIPKKLSCEDNPIYGVYSHYESDASGFYTLTAGVKVNLKFSNPDFKSLIVESGSYLVFEAHGPMPEAIIQAWKDIWLYFSEKTLWQRAYKTDFEFYQGLNQAEIYIGVMHERA